MWSLVYKLVHVVICLQVVTRCHLFTSCYMLLQCPSSSWVTTFGNDVGRRKSAAKSGSKVSLYTTYMSQLMSAIPSAMTSLDRGMSLIFLAVSVPKTSSTIRIAHGFIRFSWLNVLPSLGCTGMPPRRKLLEVAFTLRCIQRR